MFVFSLSVRTFEKLRRSLVGVGVTVVFKGLVSLLGWTLAGRLLAIRPAAAALGGGTRVC